MFEALGEEIDYLQEGSWVQFIIIQREYIERQCEFNKNQLMCFNNALEGCEIGLDQSLPIQEEQISEEYAP